MSMSYSKRARTEIGNKPKFLRKRTVKAKEFVAAFHERSEDSYLMAKFSISLRNLRRIYSVLIERGALSEAEYNNREGKAPELEEHENPDISTSTTVRLVEDSSDAVGLTHQGIDPGRGKDVSLAQQSKRPPQKVADLCPNCGKPRNSSSSDECIYCGVIFTKLEILKRKRTTLSGSPTPHPLSS